MTDLFGADSNTYANVFTFLGRPLSRSMDGDVDAVILGVPYDLATSARPGARSGPNGIRQASAQLRWEQKRWPWKFALNDVLKVVDYGDLDFDIGDSQTMVDTVTEHADKIIAAGKFLLTFGGDHFVSLPVMRGVAKHHPKLALVHFDAHTDTEESPLQFYHGSMFQHAMSEGLFEPERSIQLGIRTEYEADDHPLTVLDATWINNNNAEQAVEQIRAVTAGLPVYLSIDIDFLDPAYAPGTGTPVSGGATSDKLLQILRGLTDLNIVAADVMEVAPAYDHAGITSLAAATAATELLYLRAARLRQ